MSDDPADEPDRPDVEGSETRGPDRDPPTDQQMSDDRDDSRDSTEGQSGDDGEAEEILRPGEGGGGGGLSRRTLVRILLALALGIPILIESLTFLGLIRSGLFGGDDEDGGTPTRTTTTPPEGVGVGDELLPSTAPTETVQRMEVRESDGTSVFDLTVTVENIGNVPYELQFATMATRDNEIITDGGGTSGRIEPGQSATVSGVWTIPNDAVPASVRTVSTFYGDETTTVANEVALGPVEGV